MELYQAPTKPQYERTFFEVPPMQIVSLVTKLVGYVTSFSKPLHQKRVLLQIKLQILVNDSNRIESNYLTKTD
jgi:hypothetical protein